MRADPAIRNIPASFDQLDSKVLGAPDDNHRVVSLFSGCGGMDLGFLGGFTFGKRYYDRLPFEIVWANDSNLAACATYERNLQHPIHVGDVSGVLDTLPKQADVVIGGFPCQDVSINGSRQAANGTRTILYQQMIEAIRRTSPRIFVAENVKGLLLTGAREFYDQMLVDFGAAGYRVSPLLYLAADFGVPQMRERLFIVGMKGNRIFKHPRGDARRMTAQEALRDLEDEPENPSIGHLWSKAALSPEQGARRLTADKPATTIRAEHHGNTQWHYRLPRRISLREAARLQSFPDEFRFEGGMRETERQIGNAVPPVLAWHIAKAVREQLDTGRVRGRPRSGSRMADRRPTRQHDAP